MKVAMSPWFRECPRNSLELMLFINFLGVSTGIRGLQKLVFNTWFPGSRHWGLSGCTCGLHREGCSIGGWTTGAQTRNRTTV